MSNLALGLLDTSAEIADPRVAAKARSLTIDWSRFKYSGPILEASELPVLLTRARERGYRYCLVQRYGHVLAETWRPGQEQPGDALSLLRAELGRGARLAIASADDQGAPGGPPACLLVDLERWEAGGRPDLVGSAPGQPKTTHSEATAHNGAAGNRGVGEGTTRRGAASNGESGRSVERSTAGGGEGAASNGETGRGVPSDGAASNGAASNGAASNGAASNGAASSGAASSGAGNGDSGRGVPTNDASNGHAAVVEPFPPALASAMLHLEPERPAAAAALAPLLGSGISGFDPRADDSPFSAAARRFLEQVQLLTGNLRRGVFVWNVEPYDDVEQPPDGFGRPLSSLYSVAAGFKPNRILETHGFASTTRVVFYDYSRPGLTFRRLLTEEWDGRDYPGFLRHLFARLPAGEAHYCLGEGQTPDNLDWGAVERRWQQELDAWGGARRLARHWQRYRRLRHEYVHCDLLAARQPLIQQLRDEEGAVIWWSNAFFSYVSNWFYPPAERRRLYGAFLAELVTAAPRLWLYGASSDNVAVNHVQAAAYRRWWAKHGGDELEPGKLHRHELRF